MIIASITISTNIPLILPFVSLMSIQVRNTQQVYIIVKTIHIALVVIPQLIGSYDNHSSEPQNQAVSIAVMHANNNDNMTFMFFDFNSLSG